MLARMQMEQKLALLRQQKQEQMEFQQNLQPEASGGAAEPATGVRAENSRAEGAGEEAAH